MVSLILSAILFTTGKELQLAPAPNKYVILTIKIFKQT